MGGIGQQLHHLIVDTLVEGCERRRGAAPSFPAKPCPCRYTLNDCKPNSSHSRSLGLYSPLTMGPCHGTTKPIWSDAFRGRAGQW
jgi:hypothetical protein